MRDSAAIIEEEQKKVYAQNGFSTTVRAVTTASVRNRSITNCPCRYEALVTLRYERNQVVNQSLFISDNIFTFGIQAT